MPPEEARPDSGDVGGDDNMVRFGEELKAGVAAPYSSRVVAGSEDAMAYPATAAGCPSTQRRILLADGSNSLAEQPRRCPTCTPSHGDTPRLKSSAAKCPPTCGHSTRSVGRCLLESHGETRPWPARPGACQIGTDVAGGLAWASGSPTPYEGPERTPGWRASSVASRWRTGL